MTLGITIAWIVLIVAILFLVWLGVPILLKSVAHKRDGDYWFFYHFMLHRIKRPNLESSQYYDRFPKEKEFVYGATLDDYVLTSLAQTIMENTKGKSAHYRAGYILAFVQQSATYRKDIETYGEQEMYEFPICTLFLRGVDCEGVAFLGLALSTLCGIDSALIRTQGHVAYGVNIEGHGTRFDHDGKFYLWCEGTSTFPMGIYSGNRAPLGTWTPEVPPSNFIADNTYELMFAKFKC